jgi:hypothetical protein
MVPEDKPDTQILLLAEAGAKDVSTDLVSLDARGAQAAADRTMSNRRKPTSDTSAPKISPRRKELFRINATAMRRRRTSV